MTQSISSYARLDAAASSNLLSKIADELDISTELYEAATIEYEQVGLWLSEDENGIGRYAPEIYPQGSFRLGTVVKPINPDCDYDIDLVCHLDIKKESTTQNDLKQMVGKRLRQNPKLAQRLSPSRRCWNLTYPKQFHLDVLPAITNVEQLPSGILLTDKELVHWQKSNPRAYAEWFRLAIEKQFNDARARLAKALNASIEDIPDWRVKTPLQRAIQLLKRHRDIHFSNDPDNRPASIIITTLAAQAYQGQDNVYETLAEITARMSLFIENRNGRWWVENPVEPDENFADKWHEYPERRKAFLNWLTLVQRDTTRSISGKTLAEGAGLLAPIFGMSAVSKARDGFVNNANSIALAAATRPLATIQSDVSHCRSPAWPVSSSHKASVNGSLHYKQHGKKMGEIANRRIPKNLWLRFSVKTSTPPPYSVYWQVVNTGPEAKAAGQLRGEFHEGSNAQDVRWESTRFTGIHWVEAFIVKNGVCVARSGRKIVNVA